jgi:acyl-CoA dehydrogenase
MILLDPRKLEKKYSDARSREVMEKTVAFFENKGKKKLLEDFHDREWYSDFLEYAGREGLFATICTPSGYGAEDSRWDTWRNCEFAEILGFYGLPYWYVWQVSVLGLGPIWMSDNEEVKQRTAKFLQDGGIFAFGLSEKTHGADIYSTDMILEPVDEGRYKANGRKYYIGNGNKASIVSTFGRIGTDKDDPYVFFVADPQHESYELVKNVVASQSYVSEFALHDYPLTEADILHKGRDAWDAALNTINVGKFNLGWASIGIATHAFYEAIRHSSNRILYGMPVTEMSHVRKMFVDGWLRLVAMKLFALRAADYFRAASADDRRYLLFNPMTKMKVTTQGEEVIDLIWDAIAAKGFEKDQYFAQAAIDIRALPKLEGTVHVNIALLVKFMPNYFFNSAEFPEVGQRSEASNDGFLFNQGPTKGLGGIQFHDYAPAFALFGTPNVALFREKIEIFKAMLADCPPDKEQSRDVDYLLAQGQIFALIVYAQLILENAKIYELDDNLVDEIFDVFCRDFSRYALELHDKPGTGEEQMVRCLRMLQKPARNEERYQAIWAAHVQPLKDGYVMPD